ncbi:MAG: hypothetical protein JSR91_28345 [Proteobacteria bacterium]|nr:hypothetical protein [Pseudomonadota bacterium]
MKNATATSHGSSRLTVSVGVVGAVVVVVMSVDGRKRSLSVDGGAEGRNERPSVVAVNLQCQTEAAVGDKSRHPTERCIHTMVMKGRRSAALWMQEDAEGRPAAPRLAAASTGKRLRRRSGNGGATPWT